MAARDRWDKAGGDTGLLGMLYGTQPTNSEYFAEVINRTLGKTWTEAQVRKRWDYLKRENTYLKEKAGKHARDWTFEEKTVFRDIYNAREHDFNAVRTEMRARGYQDVNGDVGTDDALYECIHYLNWTVPGLERREMAAEERELLTQRWNDELASHALKDLVDAMHLKFNVVGVTDERGMKTTETRCRYGHYDTLLIEVWLREITGEPALDIDGHVVPELGDHGSPAMRAAMSGSPDPAPQAGAPHAGPVG